MIFNFVQTIFVHQLSPFESPVIWLWIIVAGGKCKWCLLQFPVSQDVSATENKLVAVLISNISSQNCQLFQILFKVQDKCFGRGDRNNFIMIKCDWEAVEYKNLWIKFCSCIEFFLHFDKIFYWKQFKNLLNSNQIASKHLKIY